MQSSSSTETLSADVSSQNTLMISVIVPIRNEEAFIGATLDGLLSQVYPRDCFEIIVVDGESTDTTCEIVSSYSAKHPQVQLHSNPKKWSSAARNIGVKASKGDVVVVVDGHCEFVDDQYLRNLERAFSRKEIDCLGRPQCLEVSNCSATQEAIALARSSPLGHHPDSFIYSNEERLVPAHSVAVAYRKSVFETVGFFDEDFDACEDVEFNHRIDQAGLKCLLAPQILLRYYPRSSFSGLFRQMARYGRGRVRLCRKHNETLSFKSFVPALFVLFVLLGGVLSALVPVLRLPYLGVLVFYTAVVLYFSSLVALRERKLQLLALMPIVFMAIHTGAGYGLLKEALLGKTTEKALDR